MSKIAVVFWSGTGNTEAMAKAVEDGAKSKGAEVTEFTASDFSADKVAGFDAIAFGCPAMGSEVLEEGEFQPMWDDVKGSLKGRKIVLFGSYGWGTGEWMDSWKADAEAEGAVLAADPVIANNAPDDDALAQCKALGEAIA
ncbi:flavodoxin [Acidaminococcus timonensis]|uniref:flavodoxin n=1 Tax=Acidaminococcus timonensis TaxID=1871002 RepID=UPI0025CC519F|nr:flavodoxin [Acidaminococcus timonensis]